MYKKFLILLLVFILPVHVIATGNTSSNENEKSVSTVQNNQIKHQSNQYTQPEIESLSEVKNDIGSLEEFVKAAENEQLLVYVNEKSLAIKVKNKVTGYVWNSGLDNPDEYRLNKTWKDFAQSALTIDYLDRNGRVKTESIITNQSKPKITVNKAGFTASIYFIQSKISLKVEVKLEGDQLTVSIPDREIQEGKRNQLLSINVYPFLGAVNEDKIPGYMFIPDGSGALIRYQKNGRNIDSPYVQQVYGSDIGFERTISSNITKTNEPMPITMPVFGAVHGVEQNAFLAVIENGANYGEISAYPAGVSTDVNWVSSKYFYRYEYYQPTSKNMTGVNVYQKEKNEVNIQLRYMFLSNKEADYVGMAKKYQSYLIDEKLLNKQREDGAIRLEFLGGEVKKGLLWDKIIPMTPIDRLPAFIKQLQNEDVNDVFIVYKGWSKGGLTGSLPNKFPIENAVGDKNSVKETLKFLKNQSVSVYFYTDYTVAFEGASGYAGRKDVANKISSETIIQSQHSYPYYYLTPEKSLEMANEDTKDFQTHGITHLAIDTTGHELFSDFNKQTTSDRNQTLQSYSNLFDVLSDKVGSIALYEPNVYAWGQLEKYLDIPMYSSNYMFVTDTVPFIQIVLKGYIPYYAPFSNFNATPEDDLLRMIEYGAYPSFYLTDQSSTLLSKTASKDLYTSQFTTWKNEVVSQYHLVNESLGNVKGAEIVDRSIPTPGVVKVTYSDGHVILVNYTNETYSNNGITVQAKGFKVVEGGSRQ